MFIFLGSNTCALFLAIQISKYHPIDIHFGLNFHHFTRSQARSDISLFTVVSSVYVQNGAVAKNVPLIRYLCNETNSRMRHH